MAGIVFVNAGSGPDGSVTGQDVTTALPGWDVVELDDPGRLPDLIRDAVNHGVRPIAVAGGDGTVRCAAEALAGTDIALLVIPAGTRNHFARELGNEDLEAAAQAAAAGTTRTVSAGWVNGHLFLNNASVGLYPDLVRRRERQEGRWPKAVANVLAAASLAVRGRPVKVEVDGETFAAWLVFVGNGRYGDGFSDLIERESLDSEILDIRIVRADRRFARVRVVASVIMGRLRQSRLVMARQTAAMSIGVRNRRIDVALDGEVFSVEAPLRFEVAGSAVTVLASPPGSDEEQAPGAGGSATNRDTAPG